MSRPLSPFKLPSLRPRSPTRPSPSPCAAPGSAVFGASSPRPFAGIGTPGARSSPARFSISGDDAGQAAAEEAPCRFDWDLCEAPACAEHYDVVLERGEAEDTPLMGSSGNACEWLCW
jgi:hypothetical protein